MEGVALRGKYWWRGGLGEGVSGVRWGEGGEWAGGEGERCGGIAGGRREGGRVGQIRCMGER